MIFAIIKDKVKQNRPCVTIQLSDKNFDILPCFETLGGGIKSKLLSKGWSYSYPQQLSEIWKVSINSGIPGKHIYWAVKYWNRDLVKLIPSSSY
jgi:hypothetical protein